MENQKFFICKTCGNLVGLIDNHKVPMSCCGAIMEELVPNTVEASFEKHLPDVTVSGDIVTVKVGSEPHPMTEEHNIPFIYLQTEHGGQRKSLKVNSEPEAVFSLINDKVVAVFAYCNLHGMWKVEV